MSSPTVLYFYVYIWNSKLVSGFIRSLGKYLTACESHNYERNHNCKGESLVFGDCATKGIELIKEEKKGFLKEWTLNPDLKGLEVMWGGR